MKRVQGVTTDDGAPAVIRPAFAAGSIVAGRYRLESRLGSGGGGTVWRAVDMQLDAVVAFKLVDEDVDIERWRREVAMARRISDRNVCRVHDLGEHDDLRYVTMELVEGESLRSKCRADLPADEARALFRQIVSGAAAIHAAGVVHRDLKPENVVVDARGRAVIVDFGLAKEPRAAEATMNLRVPRAETPPSQTITSAGVVVGTPRYMSPEQAIGETVDTRTDVWALGLIGHELATGTVPALQEGGGRRIAELAKWPSLAPVLRRCLGHAPDDRYADARALLAALPHARRSRVGIGLAIVAALAAVVAIVIVARRETSSRDAPGPGPNPKPVLPLRDVKVTQLTNTEAAWPSATPMSVAFDGTRVAYTTPGKYDGPVLYVRSLDTSSVTAWPLPRIERPGKDPEKLVSAWAVGWYPDNTVAVQATTRRGEWRLYRVREDGTHTLLHTANERFPVAIAPRGEETVIAKQGQALFALLPNDQLQQITTVGHGEQIVALAISPDNQRIASIRTPADANENVTIQISSASGDESKVIWRGQTATIIDDLLAWLDDDRLVFAITDPRTRASRLEVYDFRTGKATPRTDWTADYLGVGAAANGVVLQLRGTANHSVQVGDKHGWPLERVHDARTRGRLLAGWTTNGALVFAIGEPGQERVVRASVNGGLEPWPNTTAGVELPDAVVGDDVITHRTDRASNAIVIERIEPSGVHHELARVPATLALTNYVRCAGDRAAPCFLERIENQQVSWTQLDPADGKLGKLYHRRPLRERHMRSAALALDGKTLAIVEGTNEIHLVSTDDDTLRTVPTTDADAHQSVSFAADSDLWTSSIGYAGRLFGLARYHWDADDRRVHDSASRSLYESRAALRWFWRPTPNADGSKLAVVVREFHLELSRVDNL